ncbi:MAG: ZIP family metal transporter [Candidatus Omnitrophica bacterium]|nr:ZIP family metal transporter [Candidatus Omnitrophota bacterium]MDD5027401.1 ZIP family metal transporter [Candidatus Omnitrophota bacterium]MDD5662118.1 ZIP family metal transporter [Candidatus Omnitrophota bacterium]
MGFIWALGASIIVSLIAFVGIVSLLLKEDLLNEVIFLLISFSAGALIGGAFLHLIPEAIEKSAHGEVYLLVIVGFILFFILERYLHWRHCHEGKCEVHTFTYLNLVGDGVHNFIDGLIIGSSFVVNINFGVATSFAIIMHEIPQEIGDFGVLVYGGLSKSKALFYNFLSAITAILGTVIGFALANVSGGFLKLLMPVAAGGFIYIASCDLIPELHKQEDIKKATLSMVVFILGVAFMYFAAVINH